MERAASYVVLRYEYRRDDGQIQRGRRVFMGVLSTTDRLRLQSYLVDSEAFIAHQIGLPELFTYEPGDPVDADDAVEGVPDHFPAGDDDHPWHHIVALEELQSGETFEPDELDRRHWSRFMRDVEVASHEGWAAFDPFTREPVHWWRRPRKRA